MRPFVAAAAIVAVLVAAIALTGCAPAPTRADSIAADAGMERVVLQGAPFQHVAFHHAGTPPERLHVYIEHDGRPWFEDDLPSRDPTPSDLVMLRLAARDPAPVLYLGRPCYFGTASQAPCEPVWWTHRRYAREVVDSMNTALEGFVTSHPQYRTIELYGYSGGGVIAVLMSASASPAVTAVTTVAAPLEMASWAALHAYSPLAGSLDPSQLSPLPPSISQRHFAGGHDRVVPPPLVRNFVQRQPLAQYVEIEDFDHYCCWEAIWTTRVLNR